MKVKDFDEFGYTNKKPGLIFGLILIIAVLLIVYVRKDSVDSRSSSANPVVTAPEEQATAHTAEQSEDAASPVQAPVPLSGKLTDLVSMAEELVGKGELVEARTLLRRVLASKAPAEVSRKVEKLLGDVQIDLLLKPYMTEEKVEYVIRSGDSLDKISKKFGVTKELIERSNNIKNPNLIRVGDRLRFVKGVYDVRVSKGQHELLVYLDDRFVKRYLVGTGKFEKTPIGTFEIYDKIPEPPWWRPDGKMIPYGDPENILGTHWMAIRATGDTQPVRGYGIHGTTDDSSIGKSASAGCVRMHNKEVEELFTLLPIGTRVTITD